MERYAEILKKLESVFLNVYLLFYTVINTVNKEFGMANNCTRIMILHIFGVMAFSQMLHVSRTSNI